MMSPKILIVGAGPTGLNLALRLAAHGVSFRIIEKSSGPGLASRAMALHARTLEFYDQLGFADEIVALGQKLETIHVRDRGKEVAALKLNDMGKGLSPYPFMLGFPQDDHEKFLVKKLEDQGIAVEWNSELVSFTQNDHCVSAKIHQATQEETIEVAYMCGCDGARSKVREGLGLGFQGGTYDHIYYVADVTLEGGENLEGLMSVNEKGFALMMPVRSSGMKRLIGILPDRNEAEPKPTFDDVRPFSEPLLGIKVKEVNWFSTYHAHHRVAEKFCRGRCFILGDAGHIHSPTGGQGMNTGIGDAINLSWKLAQVVQGRADASLLDTYEAERIAFARLLISSTDSAFRIIVSAGILGRIFRGFVLPVVLPFMMRFSRIRRMAFQVVSQTRLNYRGGALTDGNAGSIRAGDRLPWIVDGGKDNFMSLTSMEWQVHVFGQPEANLQTTCDKLGIDLHIFSLSDPAKSRGILNGTMILVRPDGYVAFATSTQGAPKLLNYFNKHKLQLKTEIDATEKTKRSWA